ncbi:hypothetical protein GCM10022393_22620 [Aquimarina addita]|uniref:Uncharacterized protein n=1 Tax=Aquimarina addita TaxID=870485 RepID=A0ABP6UJL0_9FLAO
MHESYVGDVVNGSIDIYVLKNPTKKIGFHAPKNSKEIGIIEPLK